jgi:hypothetical protein
MRYTGTVTLKDKSFQIRGVGIFSPDGRSYSERRELSVDGESWKPLWEARFTKVKETPA